jgi:hypothetical protein
MLQLRGNAKDCKNNLGKIRSRGLSQ